MEIHEKAKQLGEVGAGIQMPPNASRIMQHYGILDEIERVGAVKSQGQQLLDWRTGRVIVKRPGGGWERHQFGNDHYVIHRADYHRVLLNEVCRLGADIHLDSGVVSADYEEPSVTCSDGKRFFADVVIGADGLRSVIRETVLGFEFTASASGDMAYRITIPRERVEKLDHPFWNDAIVNVSPRIWIGPFCHAILYPVRNKTIWNVVLCCPDTLPANLPQAVADIQDFREAFKGWDPKLQVLLNTVQECFKWKICHIPEIEKWTRRYVAVMGDACHPSLPYQGQGAAMAVEDGAVLGVLLGALSKSSVEDEDLRSKIPAVLELYQSLRKSRAELQVKGAIDMRHLLEMEDGPEQVRRNEELGRADLDDINDDCPWIWASLKYQKYLLGFDAIEDARQKFDDWMILSKS